MSFPRGRMGQTAWRPIGLGTFSPCRLLAAMGGNNADVGRLVPGSGTPATVSGFVAAFVVVVVLVVGGRVDVDLAHATRIGFHGVAGALTHHPAPPLAGTAPKGLRFVGVQVNWPKPHGRVVAGIPPLNPVAQDLRPEGWASP